MQPFRTSGQGRYFTTYELHLGVIIQIGGGRAMAGLNGRVHAQLGGELEVHALVGALEGSPIMPLDSRVGGMCEHRRAHAEHVHVPGGGGERRAQGGGADDERGHR